MLVKYTFGLGIRLIANLFICVTLGPRKTFVIIINSVPLTANSPISLTVVFDKKCKILAYIY